MNIVAIPTTYAMICVDLKRLRPLTDHPMHFIICHYNIEQNNNQTNPFNLQTNNRIEINKIITKHVFIEAKESWSQF